MDNEILIKALSAIARTDGGNVELNAKACCLLARRALYHYASQGDQEQECVCGHTLEGHTTILEDNFCTGVGCECTQFHPKYLPGAGK